MSFLQYYIRRRVNWYFLKDVVKWDQSAVMVAICNSIIAHVLVILYARGRNWYKNTFFWGRSFWIGRFWTGSELMTNKTCAGISLYWSTILDCSISFLTPFRFYSVLKAERESKIFWLPPVGELGVYSKKKHTEKRNETYD